MIYGRLRANRQRRDGLLSGGLLSGPDERSGDRLERFGEFLGEGAVAALRRIGAFVLASATLAARPFEGGYGGDWSGSRCTVGRRGAHCAHCAPQARWWWLAFLPGRLCRVRTQEAIFQRSPVKAADDRLHFFGVRGIDEGEALGLLRFGVADDFDRVGDQILGGEPGPDVVGSYPDRQIPKENRVTHSEVLLAPLRIRGFSLHGWGPRKLSSQ